MDISRITLIVIGALASIIAAGAIIAQPLSSAVGTGDNETSMNEEESAISEGDQTILAADDTTGENEVVMQGTLSSPGEEGGPFQVIDILPPREDGKTYVGMISFTATKPIFVAPMQTFGVGDKTLDPSFGDLLVFPGGPNGTLVAPAIITPEYSEQIESQIPIPETFSASVSFAGNGLSVGNLNGEPFLVSYTLRATVHTTEVEDNVESAITNQTEVNGTRVSIVAGSAALTDTAYDPNPVTISVGDNVTWVNDDPDPHTVTSGNFSAADAGQEFDSGYMGPHKSFTHQFNEPGEFEYFCILHPGMVGKVIVEGEEL
jgi:plastocyanin